MRLGGSRLERFAASTPECTDEPLLRPWDLLIRRASRDVRPRLEEHVIVIETGRDHAGLFRQGTKPLALGTPPSVGFSETLRPRVHAPRRQPRAAESA